MGAFSGARRCLSCRDWAEVIKYTLLILRMRAWGALRQQHDYGDASVYRLRACGDKVRRRMYRLCSFCMLVTYVLYRQDVLSVSPPDTTTCSRLSRCLCLTTADHDSDSGAGFLTSVVALYCVVSETPRRPQPPRCLQSKSRSTRVRDHLFRGCAQAGR